MKYKKYIIYVVIISALYYLLPLVPAKNFMVMTLLFFYPLANFLLGLIFFQKRLDWLLPVVSAVLFLPVIFIYYNESALIYLPIYSVINLFGCLTSKILRKGKND